MKKLLIPLLCASGLIAYGQTNDTLQWTPEFCMSFKSISGVTLSHDGKYTAYVVREPIMAGEKSEYLQNIWVAATDGTMNVQYTRQEKSSHSPAFSPDGQHLAFLSERNDETQLYLMRLMGGEPEQITQEKNGIGAFQWSPDGSRIAFLKTDEKTEEEEKAEEEKRHVIEVDKNHKYTHLYTVNMRSDSHEVQRVTEGALQVISFDWSPDADLIAFSHKADPSINTGFVETEISLVPADSGEVKPLVRRPGTDQNPKYSPDGKFIAFQGSGGRPEPIGLSDLFLVGVEDGQIVPLAHTFNRSASILGWNDDDHLIATDFEGTSRVAYQWSISKAEVNKVVMPEGTMGSAAVNAGSDIAYVHQNLEQPAELFISRRGESEYLQLTNINREVDLPAMGRTELIKWQSKDGLEIEGFLTYPVDYQVGEKVPLILQIHGGPSGVFSHSFTGNPSIYPTQYFAQQGMAVLRPNPRGSTGYGRDFRYANFRDWGYGDYEDVMSGVDKVIEMGVADEKRMAVMGWSYGGYLTSFVVTRTDRFKAASMGAGLPNLISMVTTNDIPDYLVGHMGAEFFDDYETYEKHSAIYRIKNVTTPTQIIHGANDLRVPFTQGQEFYGALKRLGVSTEMLVLPRTPHGPREPKLLMEVSPRIMKWFNKYLTDRS